MYLTVLEYPEGGRLEMNWDPEGRSSWYYMTSLQTCKQFLAILQLWGFCLVGSENCFQQPNRLPGHVYMYIYRIKHSSIDQNIESEFTCFCVV